MSDFITWTDEQLTTQLERWSDHMRRGIEVQVVLNTSPVMSPRIGPEYSLLLPSVGKVMLTLPQAQMVQEWMQNRHDRLAPKRNPRDTQFEGFVHLLIDDLRHNTDLSVDDPVPQTQLMIRRIYDFACHVAQNVMLSDLRDMDSGMKTMQEVLSVVPDMRQWPEESPPQGECKECGGPCRWEYADRYSDAGDGQ